MTGGCEKMSGIFSQPFLLCHKGGADRYGLVS